MTFVRWGFWFLSVSWLLGLVLPNGRMMQFMNWMYELVRLHSNALQGQQSIRHTVLFGRQLLSIVHRCTRCRDAS